MLPRKKSHSHNPESAQLMYFIPAPGPHQSCPQGTAVTLSLSHRLRGQPRCASRRREAGSGLGKEAAPSGPWAGPNPTQRGTKGWHSRHHAACKEMSARLCYQLRQTSSLQNDPEETHRMEEVSSPAHRKLLQYPSRLLTTGQPPPPLPALQPHCLPTNPAEEEPKATRTASP